MTDSTAQIEAGDLLASRHDRTLRGLLVPFGEVGRTNLGRFSVRRGAMRIPEDPSVVTLNLDHQRNQPVGRATELRASDRGIEAVFAIAATPRGDDLLASAERGERTKLSAEATNIVIRGGQLVSAELYGAAAVAAGAFPSAELLAADAGELPVDMPEWLAPSESTSTSTEEVVVNGVTYVRKTETTYSATTTPKDQPPADQPPTQEDNNAMTDQPGDLAATAQRPASGAPAPRQRAATTTAPRGQSSRDLFATIAGAMASGNPTRDLFAALDQISQADVFDVVNQPQSIGEIFQGVPYVPLYSPLLTPGSPLTSMKVQGHRFVKGKKPVVGPWAGGGTQVPTNEVKMELVEETAQRRAGGWDVDRIMRDFPNPEFWAAFYAAAAESYVIQTDEDSRAVMANPASSTALLVDPAVAAAKGISDAAYKIVKGGLKLVRTKKGRPTFASLAEDLYEDLAFTRLDDSLAYLNLTFGLDKSSGMTAGDIVCDPNLADGTALVGVRGFASLHQLGGAAPIRTSAEDIAKGNLTEAVFGYNAIILHDAEALIRVEDDPAA